MSTSSSGKSLKIDESAEIDTDQESINDNMDPSELEAAEARCTKTQCTDDSTQDKNIPTADPKLLYSEHKITNLESKESQDKVVKSLAEIKNKDPRFLSKKKDVGIDGIKENVMQPNSSGQKLDPKVMSQMMSMDPWCFSDNDTIDHEDTTKKEIENPNTKSQEDGQSIKESSKTEDNMPCKSLSNDNVPCKSQSQSTSSSANKQPFKISMQNPFGKMKNLKQTTDSNVPVLNTLARKQTEQGIDNSELPSSTSVTSRKGLDEKRSFECQQKESPKMLKDEPFVQSEISKATAQSIGEDHKALGDNPHEFKNITRTVTNDLAGFQKPHPVRKPENFNRFGLTQRIGGMYGTGSFEKLASLKNSFQMNVDNPTVVSGEFRATGALPIGVRTSALPIGRNTTSPLPFGINASGSLPIGRNDERSFLMEQMTPGLQPIEMPASDPYSVGASTSGSYDMNESTSLPHTIGVGNPLGARLSATFPMIANTSLPYSMSTPGQLTARADVSGMFPMGASRLGSIPIDSSISGMSGLMDPRRFMGFPVSGARDRFMGAESLVGPSPYENYNTNISSQRGMLGSQEGSLAGDLGSLEEIERKKQRNMMELKQLEEMKFRKLQEMKAFQMMEMKNRMEKEMEMYLTKQMQPGGFDHMENKSVSNNNQISNSKMPDVLAQIQLKENQIKLLQKQKQMENEKTDLDNRKNGNKISVKQRLGLKKEEHTSSRDLGLDDFPKPKIEARKKRFGRNLSPFRDNEKSISKGGRKRTSGGSIPDDLVLTEFGENGPIKKIAKIGTSGEPQKKPSTKVSDDKDILADLDPNDPMAKCILDSFNEPTIETNVCEISGVMGSVPKKNFDTEVQHPLSKSLDVDNEIKKDALDFEESDLQALQDEDVDHVVNENILDSDEEDMLDLVFDEQEQFELERLGKF